MQDNGLEGDLKVDDELATAIDEDEQSDTETYPE